MRRNPRTLILQYVAEEKKAFEGEGGLWSWLAASLGRERSARNREQALLDRWLPRLVRNRHLVRLPHEPQTIRGEVYTFAVYALGPKRLPQFCAPVVVPPSFRKR